MRMSLQSHDFHSTEQSNAHRVVNTESDHCFITLTTLTVWCFHVLLPNWRWTGLAKDFPVPGGFPPLLHPYWRHSSPLLSALLHTSSFAPFHSYFSDSGSCCGRRGNSGDEEAGLHPSTSKLHPRQSLQSLGGLPCLRT